MGPALFFVSILLLAGCAPPPEGDGKTVILSYNVQNLFDGELDGTEYEEYRPGRGWNENRYHLRLDRLSQVIRRSDPPPDIVLLQEVENRRVIDELASTYLPEYNYRYRVLGGPTDSATQVALLSHLPVTDVRRHAPPVAGHPLRNILEARIDTGEGELLLFANHWKSRSGGGEELRRATAKLLSLRLSHLRGDPTNVVLAGDFNCEPELPTGEESLPPITLGEEREGALAVTEQISALEDRVLLFSPWGLVPDRGSYYYGDSWHRIDAFYLSEAAVSPPGLSFDRFFVHPWEDLRSPDGTPRRWITDLESGYSDHLPLLLILSDR